MQITTKAIVANLLKLLGRFPEDMANNLALRKITGVPNSEDQGPLSRYLSDIYDVPVLVRYDPGFNFTTDIKVGDDLFFFGLGNMDHLANFMYEFDHETYPQLLDQDYLNRINNSLAL